MNKFWSFKNKGEVGELYLYGEISDVTWWGDEVTPAAFKEELDALGEIASLDIYINSGGGDVFAGQTINNILKRHNAYKTVYVDGIAASIASVIAMAGDKIVMPANSMMMIHKAWALWAGNSDELLKAAEILEGVDKTILAEYVNKTGKEPDEIMEMMNAETWMTGEEAVENGFADELRESMKIAASIVDKTLIVNDLKVDISNYKNLPLEQIEEQPKQTNLEVYEQIIDIHRRRN